MSATPPRAERLKREQRRIFRLAIAGTAIGICIAYPMLISAKLADELPTHMSWAKVILGPVAFYGFLLGMMWFAARRDLKTDQQFEQRAP